MSCAACWYPRTKFSSAIISISSGNFDPIMSMRHKPGVDILTQLTEVSILLSTNDDVLIYILVDAILVNDDFQPYSQFIEKDITANGFSGGRKIGVMQISKDSKTESAVLKSKFRLGQKIDGTPQRITLVGKSFSSPASLSPVISFKEFF